MHRYCDQWITAITDLTATVHKTRRLLSAGQIAEATAGLPAEHVYPLSPELARAIGAGTGHFAREEGAR